MTVDYIVITPGVQTLPDGRTIEAGTHSTQTLQHGTGVPGAEGWDTVNFTSTFASTASVLLQIQDLANESSSPPSTTSIPWITASTRNVGTTSFQTVLERNEVNDGGRSPSTRRSHTSQLQVVCRALSWPRVRLSCTNRSTLQTILMAGTMKIVPVV